MADLKIFHGEKPMWVHPTNIIEYLRMLPRHSRTELYRAPAFAVSFLKIFDENTVRFIFDLLLRAHSISSLKEMDGIKDTLKTLLKIQMIEKRGNNIYLDEGFRASLEQGFCILSMEKHYRTTGERMGADEARCSTLFEDLLRFIVNRDFKIHAFGVREVLLFGELLDAGENITNRGFEFLLMTKKEQLWSLILLSLKYFLGSVEEEIAVIEAIFELSTRATGAIYEPLLQMNNRLLRFLESLGLLRLRGCGVVLGDSFIQLFEDTAQNRREFIVLETNHRVYAYAHSEYEKSVIGLFCEIAMRLPNLIKGALTEESVNGAFNKGITSNQIIHFLEFSVKGRLPPTVSNQIRIWESKRNRIFMAPGYLYSNFLNLSDYQRVLDFCTGNNCLIESDLDRRMIVVCPEAHALVKGFVKTLL